jgi:hypothetical protein
MKNVPLGRTYTVGSAIFESLSFREPKLADYRQIGKAIEVQRGVVVTYPDAIWSYADRLLQVTPPGALNELDLVDALAVEDAIIDFFSEASKQLHERGNSSSASAGDPPTSTP